MKRKKKKKEMIPLTSKERKLRSKQQVCYICNIFSADDDSKKYQMVGDHCHYT